MKGWMAACGVAALMAAAPVRAQGGGAQAAEKQANPNSAAGDTQSQADTGADGPEEAPSPSALTADTQRTPTPGLIGDWLDIRTRLGRRGIGLTARYASESAYNFTGGDDDLFRETGQFDAGVLFDLDKTIGLKGGAFQATLTFRRGRNLTADANLGALQQVQEVYGRGQTLRVTQFWYEQVIGEKLEVKLGLTNPGEDFNGFSCQFMNLSFCGAQPGNLVGDYWANWPVSQIGARARVALSKESYISAGVYQVNPRNINAERFYFIHVKGGTGVLVPVEVGTARTNARGHVASYKLGGWYSNANGDDVLRGIDGRPSVVTGLDPLSRSSRYGVYATLERQLTGRARDGKAVSGLSVFANVTQADRATTVTDNQVALGLFYRGLFPSLRGETLGVAVARTNVNGRVARAQRLDPTRPDVQSGAEYAAEIYYSLQPIEGLELRPNVQWIHHPGGVPGADDVGVVGLKAAVTL